MEREGWVVLWRKWAGVYIAWHMGDPNECRVVEAGTESDLLQAMIAAEIDFCARGNPAALKVAVAR